MPSVLMLLIDRSQMVSDDISKDNRLEQRPFATYARRKRRDFGLLVRVAEQDARIPVTVATIAYPVRRRPQPTVTPPMQH